MGRVRQKHSREFKLEAVRALRSGQHTTSELARRLGVTESYSLGTHRSLPDLRG
jgi:transposase-like protein